MITIPDINATITHIEIETSENLTLHINKHAAMWLNEVIGDEMPLPLQCVFTGETKVADAITKFNTLFPPKNRK